MLSLHEMIEHFIEFRREVVRRRTEFELRKAEARAHILEGLKIALDHLDEVITLIRGSKNPAEARERADDAASALDQLQAQAILDMQLQRLTGLERQKILDELAELLKTIERLRAILSSDELLIGDRRSTSCKDVREKYGDERRTEIVDESGELRVEDLIADEDVVDHRHQHGLHQAHRARRIPHPAPRRQGPASACATREEDFVSTSSSPHARLHAVLHRPRAVPTGCKVYEIPEVGRSGKGKAIVNLCRWTRARRSPR